MPGGGRIYVSAENCALEGEIDVSLLPGRYVASATSALSYTVFWRSHSARIRPHGSDHGAR